MAGDARVPISSTGLTSDRSAVLTWGNIEKDIKLIFLVNIGYFVQNMIESLLWFNPEIGPGERGTVLTGAFGIRPAE